MNHPPSTKAKQSTQKSSAATPIARWNGLSIIVYDLYKINKWIDAP